MKTAAMMWTVAAALVPAAAASALAFGEGVGIQLAAATFAAVVAEVACLAVRRVALSAAADGSAAVCGMIVGLSVPPLAPWWCAAFAAAAGIVLAKHCYGGLGNNPFNPAMAGYALAFVSFPSEFSAWADATAAPTPLLGAQLSAGAGGVGGSVSPWWLSVATVAGGMILLALRIADWRLPVSFLLTVVAAAMLFGEMSAGTHLRSGGLLLAAFFVLTDPATCAGTPPGRWLFGLLVGALTVWIRESGAHADGIAFAVLVGNMLAPLLDRAAGWRPAFLK